MEPESPCGLSKAILEMHRDKHLALEMGKRGREYLVANFNREKMVSWYIDLLKRCDSKGLR